jgi:hypothetical protein
MHAGPTIRPLKNAALVCFLPPCHLTTCLPASRRPGLRVLITAKQSTAFTPIFKTHKCYNFRYNIARKSFKTKDRPPIYLHNSLHKLAAPAEKRFLIATLSRIEMWSKSLESKEKTFSNSNKKRLFPRSG